MSEITKNLNDTLNDRKIIEKYGYIYPKHPLSERVLEFKYMVSDIKFLESLPESPRRNELLRDLNKHLGVQTVDNEINDLKAKCLSQQKEIASLNDKVSNYSWCVASNDKFESFRTTALTITENVRNASYWKRDEHVKTLVNLLEELYK